MKVRLPIIGQVQIGEDKQEPIVNTVNIPKKQKTLLGSVLDMGSKKLSNEKSISGKLIEAYYEWVYINVSTLAEEVSKLEPELYKVVLRGGVYEMEQVASHPVLDLLDRFNETTTQSDAFYLTEAHLDLTGDSFWYLENGANGGLPSNIYLLQPDKVELRLGDVYNGASRLVAGYDYRNTIDGEVVQESYDPEEILHIKVPNPKNPYRGFSVVEGLATSLDIDTKTLEANKSFYENGMMAQFMLSTDNKITPDQLKQLNAEMRAAYSGAKNFWKVPIFGGGIKPQTVQMSSRDAELLAQQEWLRDKIMAAFKNTKASLGITEDVNRANAEATLLSWKQSTIKPKMCRIIDSLNEFLVPRYGDNLILGFKDPVPEDMTRKIADATSLYSAGIITQNEARDMVEFDVMEDSGEDNDEPDGTEDNLPKALQSVNTKAMFRRMGLHEKKAEWKKAYAKAKPVARNIIKKEEPKIKEVEQLVSKDFTNEQIFDFQSKQLEFVERLEKQFDDRLKSYFERLTETIIGNVQDALPTKAVAERELFDDEVETEAVIALLTPTLIALAVASANHANRLIRVDSPYIPDTKVYAYIRNQIEMFADSMFSTQKDYLARLLTNGIANGDSVGKISRTIKQDFPEFTKAQADRITRTEVLRESNHFMIDAWKDSGVVEGKQWLTDSDPCEICLAIENEYGEKSLDDDFAKIGDEIDYVNTKGEPAVYEISYEDLESAPAHPNCRCTVVPIIKSQKAFDAKAYGKIQRLEKQIDKRTKEYRKIKKSKLEQDKYIKELEKLAGLGNE